MSIEQHNHKCGINTYGDCKYLYTVIYNVTDTSLPFDKLGCSIRILSSSSKVSGKKNNSRL